MFRCPRTGPDGPFPLPRRPPVSSGRAACCTSPGFTGRVPGGAGTAGKEPEADGECAAVLHEYIHWYNTERISTKLKGLSPMQYRTQALAA